MTIQEISAGTGLVKDLFGFLSWIKSIAGSDVISAYFRFHGTRVSGSEKVDIEMHTTDNEEVSWLSVIEIENYAFVRFPINAAGCSESIGSIEGQYPDPRYWRWIPNPSPGVIVSGDYQAPNAKVDFIVVGFRPDAIVKAYQST